MAQQSLNNQFFKKIGPNVEGRDFIIGDLHGCYDELLKLLVHVQFDQSKDRLFSTGDLLDRGPKSAECMELLNEPWFHCVLGNHEEILMYKLKMLEGENFQAFKHFSQEEIEYLHQFPKYINKILKLPYILEVEHMLHEKFYLVHAEFLPEHILKRNTQYSTQEYEELLKEIQNNDYTDKIDKFIQDVSNSTNDEHSTRQKLIWSRKIVSHFYEKHQALILKSDFSFLDNQFETKYKVFCGHNIVPFPIKIGQQYYLDTGAALGYSEKAMNFKIFTKFGHEFFGLSMLDVTTGEVYHCITNEEHRGKIVKLGDSIY